MWCYILTPGNGGGGGGASQTARACVRAVRGGVRCCGERGPSPPPLSAGSWHVRWLGHFFRKPGCAQD
jgi:hypothetical protein